jgi:hypothetical protein
VSGNSCKHKKGKPYNKVAQGIHGFLIYRHIILFKRLTTGEILVVRILHAQMDQNSKELELAAHNLCLAPARRLSFTFQIIPSTRKV